MKIKKKFIFIPPKKLIGRKCLGVIFLVCGSLVLAFSFAILYVLPRFFPPETEIVEIRPEEPPFVAQRILIPGSSLSFLVKEDKIEGNLPATLIKIKPGDEILVLGNKTYRSYKVVNVKIEPGSAPAALQLEELTLRLVLAQLTKPAVNIIIEGDFVNVN